MIKPSREHVPHAAQNYFYLSVSLMELERGGHSVTAWALLSRWDRCFGEKLLSPRWTVLPVSACQQQADMSANLSDFFVAPTSGFGHHLTFEGLNSAAATGNLCPFTLRLPPLRM